jgi:hypothetical protein
MELRLNLQKIMRNIINCHVENHFIHPSHKYHHLKKWDVVSTLSMENWNNIRRISLLTNYWECRRQERIFGLLAVYVTFIGFYLVGLVKPDFTYRMDWKLLSEPIIVTAMICHFIIILVMIL